VGCKTLTALGVGGADAGHPLTDGGQHGILEFGACLQVIEDQAVRRVDAACLLQLEEAFDCSFDLRLEIHFAFP
jgi:hypothetical protein